MGSTPILPVNLTFDGDGDGLARCGWTSMFCSHLIGAIAKTTSQTKLSHRRIRTSVNFNESFTFAFTAVQCESILRVMDASQFQIEFSA